MILNGLKFFSEVLIILIPILLSINVDNKNSLYFIVNFFHTYSNYLIYLLIIIFIIRYFIEDKLKNYKEKNKKLLEAIKVYRSFISSPIDNLLKEIFLELEMNEKDRLSVFLYSNSLNNFFSVGRYSTSNKYNEVGRYIIENEEEYVFKVLNDESEEHYKKAPQIKNSFFKRDKRTMESNSMYGVPIFNKEKSIKIGVLICQSMKPKVFRNKDYRKKIQEKTKKIEELLINMKIDPNYIKSSNKPPKGF